MPLNENHPVTSPPQNDVTLWRYMDIPAFLSLINYKQLTFVRCDLFEDRFEGALPKLNEALVNKSTRDRIKEGKLSAEYSNIINILYNERIFNYINCWTCENHEMVHMWKIYSKEKGVAIKTSYNLLKSAITTDEQVFPTVIKYMDFNRDVIDLKSNLITPYTIKRNEYKSENEFRLIIASSIELESKLKSITNLNQRNIIRRQIYLNNPVIKCSIDINKLISSIQISPYAPKWYLGLIKEVVKKYDLEIKEINQSEL